MKRRISHNEKFPQISQWVQVFLQIPNVHQDLCVLCFKDRYIFDSCRWTSGETLEMWPHINNKTVNTFVKSLRNYADKLFHCQMCSDVCSHSCLSMWWISVNKMQKLHGEMFHPDTKFQIIQIYLEMIKLCPKQFCWAVNVTECWKTVQNSLLVLHDILASISRCAHVRESHCRMCNVKYRDRSWSIRTRNHDSKCMRS